MEIIGVIHETMINETQTVVEEVLEGYRLAEDGIESTFYKEKMLDLISKAKEEERKQIIHEWNKAEQKLDGTTQGASNCIEHYREYLQNLPNNTQND